MFIHFASHQSDEVADHIVVLELEAPEESITPPLPDIVSSAAVAMSMVQAEEEV